MKILILDIETTGFLDIGGKIVEIGLVELDLETGEKKIAFDSLCLEDDLTFNEVNESWICNNSDLEPESVMCAKRLYYLRYPIQGIINLYPDGCTAFNNQFDFSFMESRGFSFPKKLACPMKLLTPIMKLPLKNGYSNYKWPNVQEAYDFIFPGNDYTEKHRGADDAWHEADIVYDLYKTGIFRV